MRGGSIRLSVKLPGSSIAELLRVRAANTECVGDLKEAIIKKFKRFKGLDPSELQLFKLDSSSRTLLEPMQMLSEASVHIGVDLAVELTAQPSAELWTGGR